MSEKWFEELKSAQKSCLVQDNRRKIHFTFADSTELAEEYDIRTDELLVRKWRRKGQLGGGGKWEYEVGAELQAPLNLEIEGMVESNTNPVFVRKDTKKDFEWRIRNLSYPLQTYNITVDDKSQEITIRTSNKKYFRKFKIPDMDRAELPLSQESLTFAHANNTLLIKYSKPSAILQIEAQLQKELKKLKASRDGDVECNPS